MPRRSRAYRLHALHHVMLRGVGGQNIFLDELDPIRFCIYLQEGCEKNHLNIHGFCFMSNHVHLILEPTVEALSTGIHAFTFRYAQYFNKRYERQGHLFQGRFKSIIVDDGQYAKRLIRYIHMNPIEAKLVSHPEQYRWSSFRSYVELDEFSWLKKGWILSYFGDTTLVAIENLVAFTSKNSEAHLDYKTIEQALEKDILWSREIEEFGSLKFSGDSLFYRLCSHFRIKIEDFKSNKKDQIYVDARSAFVFIGSKIKKWSNRDMAKLLGKSESNISKLLERASQYPEIHTQLTTLLLAEEERMESLGPGP